MNKALVLWLCAFSLTLAGCTGAPATPASLPATPVVLVASPSGVIYRPLTLTPESAPLLTEVSIAARSLEPDRTPSATLQPPADTDQPSPSAPLSAASITPWPSKTPRPPSTSDLLYLADSKLMRWDHVTGYTVALIDEVVEYSASISGRQVALLRAHKLSANGETLYNLDLLDFDSKQFNQLVEETARLYHLRISPNGQWMAYTSQEDGGGVYTLPVADPSRPIKLGECQRQAENQCAELAWSPDSRYILWNEAGGMWMADMGEQDIPGNTAAQLVHPNEVEIIDPKGAKVLLPVTFSSLAWSPLGRFVLTQVVPLPGGARWLGILDTRKGRLAQVPDSFEYTQPLVSAGWRPNGELFVGNGGDPAQQIAPFIKLWQALPTSSDILVLRKTLELHSIDFPPLPFADGEKASYCLDWLAPRPDSFPDQHGILGLGVRVPATSVSPTLFDLDLDNGRLRKLAEIPNTAERVLWSPDGEGALIVGGNAQVLFIYFGQDEIVDLRSLFGAGAHDFTWLPPVPRK